MKVTSYDNILILRFNGNKKNMNEVLDPISNVYEGVIYNREGHNFPSNMIPASHQLSKYKNNHKYVIGIYNSSSIQHELLHAKYYIDSNYREKVIKEWNEMEPVKKQHITKFLKKMGYGDNVIIDEYQAYRYTEKPNFFGVKL